MTPEQKKEFEQNIADLQPPEVAPVSELQEAPEGEPQEFSVDIPEVPEVQQPAPIDDVRDAFADGAGELSIPKLKGADHFTKLLNDDIENVEVQDTPLPEMPQPAFRPSVDEEFDEAGEFHVQIPEPPKKPVPQVDPADDSVVRDVDVEIPSQLERAQAKVPSLEEFMREAAEEGKVDEQGNLNPGAIVNGDDEEEVRQQENAGGDAIRDYGRSQRAFNEEVVRAIRELARTTEHLAGQLREVTDGHERRRT